MLRPSYTELMEVLNNEKDMDMKISSRYTIVIAASKRARQLVEGARPLASADSDKAVSIAINEMAQSKIRITTSNNAEDALKKDGGAPRMDYLSQEDLGFE